MHNQSARGIDPDIQSAVEYVAFLKISLNQNDNGFRFSKFLSDSSFFSKLFFRFCVEYFQMPRKMCKLNKIKKNAYFDENPVFLRGL